MGIRTVIPVFENLPFLLCGLPVHGHFDLQKTSEAEYLTEGKGRVG